MGNKNRQVSVAAKRKTRPKKSKNKVQLDASWLAELGLEMLPEDHQELLLDLARDEVVASVRICITNELDEKTIGEVARLHSKGREKDAQMLLERACPDYWDKVREQVIPVEEEIRRNRWRLIVESEIARRRKS